MAEKWPWNCQGRQFDENGHKTAKVGSFMATFFPRKSVAIKLPRSAVSWPLLIGAEKWPWNCQGRQFESQSHRCAENRPWNCQGRQFEVTVLKTGHETAKVGSLRTSISSWIGQMAEKRPWNCQGRQFEDQKAQRAENWPWNCQGRQFENVAVKLPRSAVWVHKKKCGSNCRPWQFYGHFFKLPDMAGLPKWKPLGKRILITEN